MPHMGIQIDPATVQLLRKSQGLTLRELAERTQLSISLLAKIETGHLHTVSPRTAGAIARTLGIGMGVLASLGDLDGGTIARLRKSVALTQRELAALAGVAPRTISNIESGRRVSSKVHAAIAAALNQFTGDTDQIPLPIAASGGRRARHPQASDACMSLYFDLDQYSTSDMAIVVDLLSQLYRSAGGDRLEIVRGAILPPGTRLKRRRARRPEKKAA